MMYISCVWNKTRRKARLLACVLALTGAGMAMPVVQAMPQGGGHRRRQRQYFYGR